jgi:hypothetical protein
MSTLPMRKLKRSQPRGVKLLKLLGVVALILLFIAHRLAQVIGRQPRAASTVASPDHSASGEALSPDDKRALDDTIRSGSHQ